MACFLCIVKIMSANLYMECYFEKTLGKVMLILWTKQEKYGMINGGVVREHKLKEKEYGRTVTYGFN